MYFGGKLTKPGAHLHIDQVKDDFNITNLNLPAGGYYTISVFDRSTTPPFVHLLKYNVPANEFSGGVIAQAYIPPNPPTGEHVYDVVVLQQPGEFSDDIDLQNFLNTRPTPVASNYFYVVSPTKWSTESHGKGEHAPSEQEAKFCRCVLHVAAKGSAYSPYAVCAKSVGTTYRWCTENVYDFESMADSDLRAYADLHGIDSTGSREDILQRI